MAEVPTPHLQLQHIRAALSTIAAPPKGHKITKKEYTYDTDGDIEVIKFYEGAELLFTLTYAYDENKNIQTITRS
jgi:hypothetical protein